MLEFWYSIVFFLMLKKSVQTLPSNLNIVATVDKCINFMQRAIEQSSISFDQRVPSTRQNSKWHNCGSRFGIQRIVNCRSSSSYSCVSHLVELIPSIELIPVKAISSSMISGVAPDTPTPPKWTPPSSLNSGIPPGLGVRSSPWKSNLSYHQNLYGGGKTRVPT